MKMVNAVITGRVQGVAYRYWTAGEAVKRDLTGFVRNRVDAVSRLFSAVMMTEWMTCLQPVRRAPQWQSLIA